MQEHLPHLRNLVLSSLPENEFEALSRHLVAVDLPIGRSLSTPSQPIEYLYFPNSGLISTDATTAKGEMVEVGIIGREGFSGLPALLDQPQMSHQVMMQEAGEGLRIRSAVVRDQFLRGGMLQRVVHAFAYLQMVQVSQSVLCNRMHSVEQRMARWLLASADRTESEALYLTHEFLGQMLGVQRSTVTVTAGELQRQGVIGYSRGRIEILDRRRLRTLACECYGIVQSAYDRMLRMQPPASAGYLLP
ncbi:MAG: Crp/Fnr family transcriptional regulator [Acidobacteriota bacterium]|nr:Crp/Fnr family transcriptional regulator [Acidobacteriota bacterium]